MSDIPKRLYADRGPNGGWMYRDELMKDTEHQFVRQDMIDKVLAETSDLLMSSRQKAYELGVSHGKASLLSEQVMEKEIAKLEGDLR